ncbi:MAG: hypothetical protein ACPHVJ_03545 [Psychrobacter sp.]
MALLDTLKDRQDNKYISFWGLVSNIIAVDEERSDSSYASNETYPTVVEALLRLKLHEKVRYFIYDPDDFTFSQIDEPETDEAKLFLKMLLPKSGKKLAPTEVIEIQNQFKNYFWLKESIEQVLPNGIVDFTNPLFFGAGELRPLEMNSSLINAAPLIELQRLQERVDELEAEKSNGSFATGTPTVSHGEPRTNEQLINELEAANDQITRLKSQLEQSTTDRRSYTTPAMNIMDKVITEFWLDYNPNQSAPKQEIIVRWITGNFDGVSKALALNIDKVCRHSEARSGGKYKR